MSRGRANGEGRVRDPALETSLADIGSWYEHDLVRFLVHLLDELVDGAVLHDGGQAVMHAAGLLAFGRALGAQVAQALYNLAGQPKTKLTDSFSDVPVTHQARTAIAWAEKTGIMEGVGGGKFSPDRSVTRQEAATLLTRQRKLSGEDTAADGSIVKQFTDGGTIADWAAAGVAYCAKTGLVQGKPGKVFAPKSTITRAEMATIMQRIAA